MTSEISSLKSFNKGQLIFREGQPASTAYLIKKGSVNVYRTQENKKRIIKRLGPGEIFGEMGALAGAPRTVGAEAAEYCDLMVLTRQFVKNMLDQAPKTVRHLFRLLVKRAQEAENRSVAVDHKSTFLSVCRLLELAHQAHVNTPAAEAKANPHHDKGVPKPVFSRTVKDVLLISQLEIDRILDQLAGLKIIELTTVGAQKAFAEVYIKLANPGTFMQVVTNLQKEIKAPEDSAAELEYLDIFDLAESVGSTPEILYKKIAQSEFPESLFGFPRKNVLEWAETKDKDFFKHAKRKKKKIEDLEDVADVVFVDNATLKKALSEMGYYKIGVLLSIADEEAGKKILANLSKKIATIVQDEAKRRGSVDEGEALDVQDELVTTIKSLKGVSV